MTKQYLLVTGSSSGIGREIAVKLSSTYNIVLHGRNKDRLQNVYKDCFEGNHLIWEFDLEDINNLENSFVTFIQKNNIKISKFVHSAGMMINYPVRMLNVEIFQRTYNTNVVSAALLTKVLTGKKTNEKSLDNIVFISSNISNFGAKSFSVYGSSKAALDGLMRSLAMELAPEVRVNSVLSGSIETPLTSHIYDDKELIERMAKTYPLGLGNVNDISSVVKFLLSDDARWITGQQITVDGGRTINISG